MKQLSLDSHESSQAPNFSGQDLVNGKVLILPTIGESQLAYKFIVGGYTVGAYESIVGDILTEALHELRKEIPIVPPDQTISLINEKDMTEVYSSLMKEYRETGILKKGPSTKIAGLTKSRYLMLPVLVEHETYRDTRLSFFGLKVAETREADLRLFLQIWDSTTGQLVWQGTGSAAIATDNILSVPVLTEEVARRIWRDLVPKIP
jgi:hypothetical protein